MKLLAERGIALSPKEIAADDSSLNDRSLVIDFPQAINRLPLLQLRLNKTLQPRINLVDFVTTKDFAVNDYDPRIGFDFVWIFRRRSTQLDAKIIEKSSVLQSSHSASLERVMN
ncbi:hypothetical protein J7432_20935, partial [Xanthomonas axonopodis pv. begoniae]|nr:hypothetical protein [Xanthomonas axonopodis pv. begoniae]MBO9773794.1 hypothetical protein [Xanthomonas axonopodis pv. begoniae]